MSEPAHDAQRLKELQALPLERKIQITQTRIIEFYQRCKGQVVVSFSGGKDSTVLLHLVRTIYPNVKAVFCNTGLEYPEIQAFARSKDNVDVVNPSMRFDEVITKYGYPIVSKEVADAIYYARRIRSQSVNVEREREREREDRTARRKKAELMGYRPKRSGANWGGAEPAHPDEPSESATDGTHSTENQETKAGKTGVGGVFSNAGDFGEKSLFNKEKWLPLATEAPYLISRYCCAINKKKPLKAYQKANGRPYIATLADESRIRKQAWIRHGCNVFDGKDPKSQPLSFWLEQDILAYIAMYDLKIASVYGDVVSIDEDGNEYAASFTGAAPLKTTGVDRTGCIFCLFGAHSKDDRRFVLLKQTHPKHYDYCMRGGNGQTILTTRQTRQSMTASGRTGIPKRYGFPGMAVSECQKS